MAQFPHKYGAKAQYVEQAKESPPLDKEKQRYIQAVVGTLLYYSRAINPTMLVALNAIVTQQALHRKNNGKG
jgi:hypothetical protein